MQYYLDSTARLPERKLSPAGGSFVPYRPAVTSPLSAMTSPLSSVTSPDSAAPLLARSEEKEEAAEVNSKAENGVVVAAVAGTTSDGSTTESDEDDDSESLTTEASDMEVSEGNNQCFGSGFFPGSGSDQPFF